MTEPLYCMVEIPKGSRNMYEWDERRQATTLDRFLFSSVVYPTDYGFIPDTLAEDGDPLPHGYRIGDEKRRPTGRHRLEPTQFSVDLLGYPRLPRFSERNCPCLGARRLILGE